MNVDVVSVEGSIGSEKVAVGEKPRTTPVAPFGGVVPVTVGAPTETHWIR